MERGWRCIAQRRVSEIRELGHRLGGKLVTPICSTVILLLGGIMEILTINPKELTEQEKDEVLDIDSSCSEPSPYINFLAKDDNRVIGYATLDREKDRWHFINLAVCHGCQRKGIGEKLIEEVLRYIRKIEIGTANIYLTCATRNTVAQSVYKRSNFEIVEMKSKFYGDGSDAFVMERRV